MTADVLAATSFTISDGVVPTHSRPVAYGYAGAVQVFAAFEAADRPLVEAARNLCNEYGRAGKPALASVAAGVIYISGGK